MARGVRTTRRGPRLTGRVLRRAARLGVLGAAVLVGRKTAGARKAQPTAPGSDAQATAPAPAGPGGAAGAQAPPEHASGPAAPSDPGRGRQASQPQQIPPRGWRDIALRVRTEVKQDQVPLLAAGVAFYTLLSLFPAVIAAVSIYGLAANPDTVRAQIERLTQLLSPETAAILGQQVRQITSGAGGALGLATALGIAVALWSASSGMKALITGVNLAYDEAEGRKFFKLRGLALLLTVGAMLLLGVALVLIVAFPALTSGWPVALRWTASVLRWVLLAGLLVAGLAVLYRFAPDRDSPRWSWASPGSVVATVLWVLASVGFSVYVRWFGNYNKTYGALAGIVILMLWLWLTALVVLVGAELNTEMELQTARDTTSGPEQPLGQRQAHAADHVAAAP
jgi:membrane protein